MSSPLPHLWLSTMRTRGLQPVTLANAVTLYGLAVAFTVVERGLSSVIMVCCLYALSATTGLIGEDVKNGSVQLVLARPVTRPRYLAARLLAGLTLALGFLLVSVLTAAAVRRPSWELFWPSAVTALSATVWTVVLIFFFSTVLPGKADALAALGLFVGSGSLYMARSQMERPWAVKAVTWLWDNAVPIVHVSGPALSPAETTDLLRWACNVALVVLGGVLVFNQRQFGYAD